MDTSVEPAAPYGGLEGSGSGSPGVPDDLAAGAPSEGVQSNTTRSAVDAGKGSRSAAPDPQRPDRGEQGRCILFPNCTRAYLLYHG